MTTACPVQPVEIAIASAEPVSGLLQAPIDARAAYVFAHGAGAGMTHPFMATIATGFAERGIATLRYQFPAMQRGSKRPDSPTVAHAAVRAAVAAASRLLPGKALVAGGKSFGGRMTSQAQAESALPGVRGLVFLGFPLHPPKRPSDERAEHLSRVEVPMLFLQGTRDDLADAALLRGVLRRLGERATLRLFEGADHSFHVPAGAPQTDESVRSEVLDQAARWIDEVLA